MDALALRSSPQPLHTRTLETRTVSTVRVLAQRLSPSTFPLPLAPARVRAVSSLAVCEGGLLELVLSFPVCFSMNTAMSNSNSISSASNRARLSADILPAADSCSNRPLSVSNSSRRDCLLTVAMVAYASSSASTAIIAARTATRSARGNPW